MLTVLDYANISQEMYGGSHKPKVLKEIETAEENRLSGIFAYNIDRFMKPQRHLFCQLYLKFRDGKATDAVMGIRGTLTSDHDNVYQDVRSYWSDVLGLGESDVRPDYFMPAMIFYDKCRLFVRKHYPHIRQVKLTGHCEAQTSKFDKRWCELKTSGNYLTTIIMAQHAMLNMLNTLKETQYHALAYRYI